VTNDQWRSVQPVLTQAIALDPRERDRLLESAFAGDSGLRSQLAQVLRQYNAATRRFGAREQRDSPSSLSAPADTFFLAPGDMCGRYRVVRPLGVGGMGQVYLAEDVDLGTPAALKLVSNPLLDSNEARHRLRREAARSAQLRYHPHIATVLQLLELDVKGRTVTVLAMEYVGGRSASEVIAEHAIPCRRAIDWGVQIARALEFAHERGVVHCDLKPGNIQIDGRHDGDHVKVLDFGIARAVFEGPAAEAVAGTPAYMAPEQLTDGTCGPAADIYALGVTLFECLTGRRPYGARDPEELLLQVLAGPVPRVSAVIPDVPRSVDDVLARAMAKEPAERYQSMADLRRALEALQPSSSTMRWPWYAYGALAAFAFVTFLGFAASLALDQGLGRVQPVTATSVFSWFFWGLRSLVAPIVFSIAWMIAGLMIVTVARLVSKLPGVRSLLARMTEPLRRALNSLRALPTSTLAQALLLAHVAMLIALAMYFLPLLEGFSTFMMGARGSIAVLAPGNQPLHELYGSLMTAELLVFCIAWYHLLRLRARRRERDALTYIVAGIAAIGISAFLFTARFKILFHNDAERVVYGDETCYFIEDRGASVLLFCPLTYPRNVVADTRRIQHTGNIENIFSVLDHTAKEPAK
jgi:hypothetical protein